MALASGFLSRIAGRLGAYGLRGIAPPRRAEILQVLVEEMVSVVQAGGSAIQFYTPFPGLMYRADSLLTKEPDTIAWIDGFSDGSVLWDIGANVGVYSLYAAASRRLLVLAVEPAAANFHALTRNIRLNGLNDRITAYCLAFSSVTTLGVVNLASDAMGAACNQFGEIGEASRYAQPDSPQLAQGMLAFTIDDFIKQFHPPFPTHLKLDVDGLELGILSGATATLMDFRLESVLVELSMTENEETQRAMSLLREAGFTFISRGEVQGAGAHKGANHLFRRSATDAKAEGALRR
jgi:FkbM family methyltransferase